ncbi:hypothetical protein BH23ACT9_BH23ACT9_36940 [soil metagenome]
MQRRLVELRRTLDQLREEVPTGAVELGADWRHRAVVERLLERLVELAVAINSHIAAVVGGVPPEEYRASFSAAAEAGALPRELAERMAPAAGLRNVIVHDYLDVDLSLLADGANAAAEDFASYVEAIARWLLDQTH